MAACGKNGGASPAKKGNKGLRFLILKRLAYTRETSDICIWA
jgi:hypothetical protein